ncbi:MAG: hypothetical protein SFV17_07035 [Candidatus Obscuribacter sp.]|nr:hypothetical protein [Candidatus Obscuribacter sp.]
MNLSRIQTRHYKPYLALLLLLFVPALGGCGSAVNCAIDNKPVLSRLLGKWSVLYDVPGDRTLHSTFALAAEGEGVVGSGSDEPRGIPFTIESFRLHGNQLSFVKQYHVPENPNLPPVFYSGRLSIPDRGVASVAGTYEQAVPGRRVSGKFLAYIFVAKRSE